MNMLMRLLASAPRNAGLPIAAILVGWYGGAKYGAPEFVINSVDGMIAKGGAMIGEFLPGGETDDAASSDTDV